MRNGKKTIISIKRVHAIALTVVLLVTLCSPASISSAADPVIPGGPTPVDGRILPKDKAGDSSAWIEIAQYDGYSLILRQEPLTNSLTTYSTSVNNNSYADSIARKSINDWYKYSLSSTSRLRNFAAMNNAMAHQGTYGTNYIDGISQPIRTNQQPTGDDIVFLLSFCEAVFYCSTQYHTQWGSSTLKASPREAYNNYYKLLPRDVNSTITPAYWLRSAGTVYHAAGCVAYQGGQPYDLANGRVMSHTVIGTYGHYRPALWVDAGIFEPDKATIIVINYDISDKTELSRYSDPINAGSYGPYTPDVIPGYDYVGLGVGSAPTSGTIAANDTKTIVFNYQKSEYDITYDPNGGSGPIVTDTETAGSAYTIKDQGYSRTGYDFAGYNTQRNGSGASYSVGQSITVTSNLTLYAQWTLAPRTITYYPNNGNGYMLTDTVLAGSTYAVRDMGYTRPGFVLGGYNTEALGGGVAYSIGQTTTITDNLSLYAQWIYASNITYMPNGPTASPVVDYGVGGIFTIKDSLFTYDGFLFAGWSLTPAGDFIFPPGIMITGLAGTLTLYAQWAPEYSITYEPNEGDGTAFTEYAGIAGQIDIAENPFSISGGTFLGWNSQPDGDGIWYYPNASITLSYSMTLYAQWYMVIIE